jgi:hypothetical protein
MMQKRTMAGAVCFLVCLAAAAARVGPMGIFEAATDIGSAPGTGNTRFLGYTEANGKLVGQYLLTAFGGMTGGRQDRLHFAYRRMNGSVRVSAVFQRVDDACSGTLNDEYRHGVMIRAGEDAGAISYGMVSPGNEALVQLRTRTAPNADTACETREGVATEMRSMRLGIQRVMLGGEVPVIEALVDWGQGAGWERMGALKMLPAVPQDILIGLCVTSGSAGNGAQALASDVLYETRAELIGPGPSLAAVPATAAWTAAPAGPAGLRIRTIKATYTEGWGRAEMNKLLDFSGTGPLCQAPGMPEAGVEAGERLAPYVNLHDSGGRGFFSTIHGFPDESFPGIDPFESPTGEVAGGDDDDYFATEATALVRLTTGFHAVSVNGAEGVVVEIGGIEVGRTIGGRGPFTADFLFAVEQEGWYRLRARHFAGGGDASLELHEIIRTIEGAWQRILLGDTTAGGSRVLSLWPPVGTGPPTQNTALGNPK